MNKTDRRKLLSMDSRLLSNEDARKKADIIFDEIMQPCKGYEVPVCPNCGNKKLTIEKTTTTVEYYAITRKGQISKRRKHNGPSEENRHSILYCDECNENYQYTVDNKGYVFIETEK